MTGKSTGGNGGQVKLITLVRVDDVQHWQDAFVERLGGGLPGAQRIVVNIVRPVEVRENAGGIEPFDAVSEGWFDSRAHAEAARDAFAKGTDKAVHLLVEKPIADSLNAARALLADLAQPLRAVRRERVPRPART